MVTLKSIHVALAAVSVGWFALRALGRLLGRGPAARLGRIAPHIVDTALLASGVVMAVRLGISPLAVPWLGVKLLAVVVYIALGMIAVSPRTPVRARVLATLAALGVAAYVALVAVRHDPTPWAGLSEATGAAGAA
ncbi:MAG: SirB2 family protein [Ectothiorhodospiraceae bacterium]|nr:SirB2 family protein [Chromatiales bacterium]MCP5153755.1 SirB2 family protein [Ectothiorhodospiraceae bacterium]